MAGRTKTKATAPADDFSACALAWDKSGYNQGDPAVVQLTGFALSQLAFGALTANLVADDGQVFVLSVPSGASVATKVPVKLQSVTDAAGRTYKVAANGLSASTIA